jgi:hypothetical protein
MFKDLHVITNDATGTERINSAQLDEHLNYNIDE